MKYILKKANFSILIFIAVIFMTSCNNNQENEATEEIDIVNESLTNKTLIKIDSLEILKHKKIEIDSFAIQTNKKPAVYVKLFDQSDLFKIEDENYPEPYEIETIFYILKNNSGKVIWTCEIPQSQSGDWFVTFNHYYDENGKTFAFERQTNAFNSVCSEIVYETKTEYFDSDLESIGNDYKLLGDEGKKLKKKNCDLMDFEYIVFHNIDDFLKTNKIKKKHKIYIQDSGIYSTEFFKKIDDNINNYISACIEMVDSFSPTSNLGYVNVFNIIFGNDVNFVNKPLLKKQLLEVLTNKEKRDLFFKGYIKYFKDESSIYMNIERMNDYSDTQFNSSELTNYIIENQVD